MNALANIPKHLIAGSMARGLFTDNVALSATDPRAEHAPLWAEEHSAMENAVMSRRREFTAGRVAARQAMTSLGIAACAIPAGADRAPIWPTELVGSISHCATACLAVVGRRSDVASLGVDLEHETLLADNDLRIVCTETEIRWLKRQPNDLRVRLSTLIFSAKECVYKCQYPLTRHVLEFADLSIDLDLRTAAFNAEFNCQAGDFRKGHRLSGRFSVGNGLVVTALSLAPWDMPRTETGRAS